MRQLHSRLEAINESLVLVLCSQGDQCWLNNTSSPPDGPARPHYLLLSAQPDRGPGMAGLLLTSDLTPPPPRASTLPALRAMTVETTSTVTWAVSPSVGVSQASTSTTWPAHPPWQRGQAAVNTSTACWLTGVSGVCRRFVSAGRTPGGNSSAGQARPGLIFSSLGGMELSVYQVRATG